MKKCFPVLLVIFCVLFFLSGCKTNSYREGVVPEDIDVPKPVLEAAIQYVEEQYDFYRKHAGILEGDGEQAFSAGTSAVYDRWKVEYIKLIYQYPDVEEYDLDLYQMDYWLHTTTPNQVTLPGGMQMEDDWVLPTYPGCTYLVFDVTDGKKPAYLFTMMSNDMAPGDADFLEDIKDSLQKERHR